MIDTNATDTAICIVGAMTYLRERESTALQSSAMIPFGTVLVASPATGIDVHFLDILLDQLSRWGCRYPLDKQH